MWRRLLIPMAAVAVGLAGVGGWWTAYAEEPVCEEPSSGGHGPGSGGREPITGTVTDGDGRPVEGALVGATSLDDPPRAVPEKAVLTSPQGAYEWTSLQPGRYEMDLIIDGETAAIEPVSCSTERPDDCDITVK